MGASVPFRNNILAGTALVRDAIKSSNYVTNTSGWIVRKDGTAEFADVTLRGGLIVTNSARSSNYAANTAGWILRSNGTAEFNNDMEINGSLQIRQAGAFDVVGTNVNDFIRIYAGPGTPVQQFYVNPLSSSPADMSAFLSPGVGVISDNAGLGITSGPDAITQRGMNLVLTNTQAQLGYSPSLAYGIDDGAYLRLDNNRTTPGEAGIEMGWSYLGSTAGFRVYEDTTTVFGVNGLAGYLNDGTTPTWYPKYVDGRAYSGAIVDTNTASTTVVTVASANVQNVDVWQDRMYRVNVRVQIAGTVLNDRVTFLVANGTTQVGQAYHATVVGATGRFIDVEFTAYWRQTINATISNLNLRVSRTAGTGTVTVRVEQDKYFMMVEEAGSANIISGL